MFLSGCFSKFKASILRSMEGLERAEEIYNLGKFRRFWL